MAEASKEDRIEDVAPGDIVAVDRGSGEKPYKVVFLDTADSGYLVTFEDDDGETFQLAIPAGAEVQRSLESKWESTQSHTTHNGSGPPA
jgi:hypothetical protein